MCKLGRGGEDYMNYIHFSLKRVNSNKVQEYLAAKSVKCYLCYNTITNKGKNLNRSLFKEKKCFMDTSVSCLVIVKIPPGSEVGEGA